jgi:hypothetical protein
MHSDIHLQLHALRAAELRAETARYRRPRKDLCTQLGWILVELGLRLVQRQPPARAARIA